MSANMLSTIPSHRPAVQITNGLSIYSVPSVAEDLGGGGGEVVGEVETFPLVLAEAFRRRVFDRSELIGIHPNARRLSPNFILVLGVCGSSTLLPSHRSAVQMKNADHSPCPASRRMAS